jgi:hypothetical protein
MLTVPPVDFSGFVLLLPGIFRKPKSNYPLRKIRFSTIEDGKKVGVFFNKQREF